MSQKICLKTKIQASFSWAACVAPSVVYKKINMVVFFRYGIGEGLDRVEATEVKRMQKDCLAIG
jgi:hypothetical protein